jgi:hypothetical protein
VWKACRPSYVGPDGLDREARRSGAQSAPEGAPTTAPTISHNVRGRPWGVVVDSAYVYWADKNDGIVMKAPVGGGAPVTLASGLNPAGTSGPMNMAIDNTAVYWVDDDSSCTAPCATSNVMKVAK